MSGRNHEIPMYICDASAHAAYFSDIGSTFNSFVISAGHSLNYPSKGCGKLTLDQGSNPDIIASHLGRTTGEPVNSKK